MRAAAIVFQTSPTRLKETEFSESLAATNTGLCQPSFVIQTRQILPDVGQLHEHIQCRGQTSSISFEGYDKVTGNLYWYDIDRSSLIQSRLLLCKACVAISHGDREAGTWCQLEMVTSLYCRGPGGPLTTLTTLLQDTRQHPCQPGWHAASW